MVPPASHRVSRVPWYSGFCSLHFDFAYRTFTASGWLSQNHSAISVSASCSPQPHIISYMVWPLAISLAATLAIEFSFSSCRYLDVSVHGVPFVRLWIHLTMTGLLPAGFPHSDICGSSAMCASPQLFAAYHVFLRLLVPRHSPSALSCLTFIS